MVGLILVELCAGCTGVTVADSEWCGSMGASGAQCAHTLTDSTRRMSLQEFAVWWNDFKEPKVATSLRTLTEWKALIEKLCTNTGSCTAEVQAKVEAAYAEIAAAHTAAKRATTK